MPTVLSSNLRYKNINNFLSTADNESIYFAVSKPTAWPDDTTAPTPYDSYNLEYDVFKEMLYLKKITSSDCVNVLPIVPWVSANYYQSYDDAGNISDLTTSRTGTYTNGVFVVGTGNTYQPFYVITDTYNVYKCIANNNGGASTVKPTSTAYGTDPTTYTPLADGYVWIYMFTVTPADANKFLTTYWFPVRTLTQNNSTTQWNVQQSAISGGIYGYKISNAGSSYTKTVFNSDFTSSSSTSTSIVGIVGGSSTDNYYNGATLFVKQINTGQILANGLITGYVGSTKTATVSNLGSITLDHTLQSVSISPTIAITGDGSGAKAVVTGVTTGAITTIQIEAPGSGYSYANVAVTDASGGGSGGILTPILAPVGGHGSDPVVELGATNLMTKVQFNGSETGQIIDTNDYRKISVVHNPIWAGSYYQTAAGGTNTITLNNSHDISNSSANWFPTAGKQIIILAGTGKGQIRTISSNVSRVVTLTSNWTITPDTTSYYGIIAGGTVINQCAVLTISGVSNGPFSQDSTVTQSTSGATGTVVKHDTVNNLLYLTNITGTFDGSHGLTSGSTTCSVSAVTQPAVTKNLGDVMYLENRRPLTRYTDQIEDIKVVIEF